LCGREFEFAAGEELAAGEFGALAEFEEGAVFVAARAEGLAVTGKDVLVLVALGVEDLAERRIRRGTKMIARRTAAVALTRKSLLERGCGLGEITRRGLPMVAFTCGSEVTGIGARGSCVALRGALGETGESGTASGSISGSGGCCVARGRVDGDGPEGGSIAAISDSGESGVPGGRMYGESTGAVWA
jgi:hypothetical protein